MGRAPCCDKANVKKGPWSPEEDVKLKTYIEQFGTGGNWIALPQKIGLKRCGKSCRLRWLFRWSIIAAQLPGRTDNDIKNYWNTRLKKKLLGRRKQSNSFGLSRLTRESKEVNEEDLRNGAVLTNSAIERLQLHIQLQNLQNPFSNFYNNPALQSSSEDYSRFSPPKVDELENSFSRSNPMESNSMQKANVLEDPSSFLTELDAFLSDKNGDFTIIEDPQEAELDYLKNINGFKNSSIWWANDQHDGKCASSNAFGYSTSIHQGD